MPVPTRRASGCSASANEQTAITIALRVPTLANCCGPARRRTWTAVISSSGSSALRFTPMKNSAAGHAARARVGRAQLDLGVGGEQRRVASPAGEAAPRLPPTVPRLRICGEPTVRDAIARPGSAGREARASAARRSTPAPIRSTSPSRAHSRELGDPGQVEQRRGPVPVEVELDHHVGAAGERQARVIAAHGKRLLEVSRAQHLHANTRSAATSSGDGRASR